MTYQDMCEEIIEEFNKRGIVMKNLKTGLVVRTWKDIWNFDSNGELFHIYAWYAMLWPERIKNNDTN